VTYDRQISAARDVDSGTIDVLLWSGVDDPHLVSRHSFGSVDALRKWLVSLGRGVGVLWHPDLLADRALAITISVSLDVPLPDGLT
jgi:hypothetical protein